MHSLLPRPIFLTSRHLEQLTDVRDVGDSLGQDFFPTEVKWYREVLRI